MGEWLEALCDYYDFGYLGGIECDQRYGMWDCMELNEAHVSELCG